MYLHCVQRLVTRRLSLYLMAVQFYLPDMKYGYTFQRSTICPSKVVNHRIISFYQSNVQLISCSRVAYADLISSLRNASILSMMKLYIVIYN